jgi:hypothetical protein
MWGGYIVRGGVAVVYREEQGKGYIEGPLGVELEKRDVCGYA